MKLPGHTRREHGGVPATSKADEGILPFALRHPGRPNCAPQYGYRTAWRNWPIGLVMPAKSHYRAITTDFRRVAICLAASDRGVLFSTSQRERRGNDALQSYSSEGGK
jgi:hypothetical protein